ncbi:LON peptidase substrate-binding domain-containing protein [Janibacter alkaliphilus]|uniref:Lon N-terminal domain-containing protein n=1 Tax=Janibacter alkaliphilus TaxID=1069963 RepID=A0A852XBP0_9MICO|nr:LON peptidase substrate-binding domain-containing protein [Janibacter alkaliphilus]NYG38153.1 hypothetical protein [Janibacter alkaliphilus]
MAVLPIFPLGTVLLPGGHLPLQIFEPRYLTLLQDLREREPAERLFGVVAIRRGHEVGAGRAEDLFAVGCTARVEAADVVREEGRPHTIRIATTGVRRFRLDELVDTGRPYLTAEVTALSDDESVTRAEARRLAERLVVTFARYQRAVGSPETLVTGPLERVAAQVTQAMPLPVRERQQILEAGGDGERLRAALALVQRELGIVTTFRAVPVPRGEANPN